MKKLLAMLLMLLLPWPALADGPAAFSAALMYASPADFARACEQALTDTSLAGSAVAEKDGAPVVDWSEYYAFAVMRRPDGLLMLCHFVPAEEGVQMKWHNDLLISHYQDVSLATQGAAWTGGHLPTMRMKESWKFTISLLQHDGTKLTLTADLFRGHWRVTEMTLDIQMSDDRWWTALSLPEDCLADDIYLATCKPDDWRRGETEEDWYGW